MIHAYAGEMRAECDAFLQANADADYAHDPAWLDVIREGYGRQTRAFVWREGERAPIRGYAAGALLESPLGRRLVALPYLDYGGPLADGAEIAGELRSRLQSEAAARRCGLEIRSLRALPGLPEPQNDKVAMILPLGRDGADPYWKRLDAKVRNQVRKAEKSAVTVAWAREEALEEFYRVFCVNMRDLGSPTHGKRFFASVLRHFPGAEIGVARRAGRCIGGLFRILWKDTLAIPWASTLRDERVHCPNNALYWESIRHAFERGCARVDFGRSSSEEGTFRFKQQWLAEERPLYWYQFDGRGNPSAKVRHVGSGRLGWTKAVWAKLPLPVANAVGPRLRGYISA